MTEPTLLIAHPSAELYGSDRVMLESVEALVYTGARVVVTLLERGPLVAEIEARGATVRYCDSPVLRKSMLTPVGLVKLLVRTITSFSAGTRMVRELKPAAIYVSTVTIPVWVLIGAIHRIPVLCHVHEAEGSANAVLRKALAAPLVFADRIVANSQYSVNVLKKSNSRVGKRARIIYNGVAGPADASEQIDREGLRVVYVGRLSPRKGVDVAVDAVFELVGRGIDARLDLVGDVFPGYEWYLQELHERIARQDHADRVSFHGFQSAVWPFLESADVIVVPSRIDEPFGNTAVEAVLAGRPVVVSDTSGLREAAAGYKSAQFVAPGSVDDTAVALQRVHADKARFFGDAMTDRVLAMDRHAPARYRSAIAAAMSGLVNGRS